MAFYDWECRVVVSSKWNQFLGFLKLDSNFIVVTGFRCDWLFLFVAEKNFSNKNFCGSLDIVGTALRWLCAFFNIYWRIELFALNRDLADNPAGFRIKYAERKK